MKNVYNFELIKINKIQKKQKQKQKPKKQKKQKKTKNYNNTNERLSMNMRLHCCQLLFGVNGLTYETWFH